MKPFRSTFFLKLTQSIPTRYLRFHEAAFSDAVLSTLFVHPQLRGKPNQRCQPCCKQGTSSAVVRHFGRHLGPGTREKGKPKTWSLHGPVQQALPPALWPRLMPVGQDSHPDVQKQILIKSCQMAKLLESKCQLLLHLGREPRHIKGCEISSAGVGVPDCICLPCELSLYKV